MYEWLFLRTVKRMGILFVITYNIFIGFPILGLYKVKRSTFACLVIINIRLLFSEKYNFVSRTDKNEVRFSVEQCLYCRTHTELIS